jgi:hypothetical protein
MKGYIGVKDNDWSNNGLRLMALGTRQPGTDEVNFSQPKLIGFN